MMRNSMNIRGNIKKLQSALIKRGKIYKLNSYQFYSTDQKRLINSYSVTEKQECLRDNGEIVMKDVELIRTCSQVEILKWFIEEWRKTNATN